MLYGSELLKYHNGTQFSSYLGHIHILRTGGILWLCCRDAVNMSRNQASDALFDDLLQFGAEELLLNDYFEDSRAP